MDSWDHILTVASVVAAFIGIGGWIWTVASWRAKNDALLESVKGIPKRIDALEVKMDILWPLFADQTLSGSSHLAKRGSGYKLTPEGEQCIKGWDPVIDRIKQQNPNLAPSDVLILVTRELGQMELQRVAHEYACTLPELYALLTVRLGVPV